MYRRILVPLDGTRFGERALPYAVSVANRCGAVLELLHVHHHTELDPGLAGMPQYRIQRMEEADRVHDRDLMASERHYLERLSIDLETRYGIRVVPRLVRGPTVEAISGEVSDVVADLVIMSSHARHGLDRFRYGHLASELIQQLNVPALCIRETDATAPLTAPPLRRMLIALDGSDFSEQILDAAIPFARSAGAEPTLLHIVSPKPMTISGVSDVPRVIPHRGEALSYLASVIDRNRQQLGAAPVVALEEPDAAVAIAKVVTDGSYDVVAMATHGRSGLSRMLMGSVAEQVLALTDRPVLLYRPRLVRLQSVDLADAFRIYGD